MSERDRSKWDARYALRSTPSDVSPWLARCLHKISFAGRALELAAGDGASALFLAERDWRVVAVDISPVGLAIGRSHAHGLPIEWVAADLDTFTPSGLFDLVSVFRFLDRGRLPEIIGRCLREGGYLVAETFHDGDPAHGSSPFALRRNEWPTLFPDLAVIEHVETATTSRFFAQRSLLRTAAPTRGGHDD
jgi:SAM-dependent methyltransferase